MSKDHHSPKKLDLVSRADPNRRELMKFALAGATAFTVPLMASFSMDGLKIGDAHAKPPGRPFGSNATTQPPGRPFQDPQHNPPGRPFEHGGFNPPGRPFGSNSTSLP
jgi:hypothetical protein